MKYFVTITPGEHSDGWEWIFEDEYTIENIVIYGGRDFKDFMPAIIEQLKSYFDDFCYYKNYYENYTTKQCLYYANFKKQNGAEFSNKEKAFLNRLFDECYDFDDIEIEDTARLLQIITGKNWVVSCMRGCCQGDYIEVIYNADSMDNRIYKLIEASYFGTGTEFIVYEVDDSCKTLEEAREQDLGCAYYIAGYSAEDIAQELNCKVDEIRIFEPKLCRHYDYIEVA